MARLLISAAHKSSGKTSVSIGICAALRERGLAVQPFKKGPDYIDPMWLALASGRPCFNLDPWLSPAGQVSSSFVRAGADADLALVEGNKGLYDGLDLDGSNSNAALAAQLGLPVVLVIDARGMTRGIAPLLLGYQAFDRGIRIAGVILNRLGGSRHEAKLRAAIEHYTDLPVLGGVHQDPALAMVERHLGLVPANEAGDAWRQVARLGRAVAGQVDLDRLLAVAGDPPAATVVVPATDGADRAVAAPAGRADALRIGVAMDRAFGFYYSDDLQALRRAGAELVAIDTLHDRVLPAIDGLYIGGGFPESCAAGLEANTSLRGAIRDAIGHGLPVRAECGGLMYLARSLSVDGRRHAMVGVVPGDAVMHARPVGRGYVQLRETGAAAWSPLGTAAGNDGSPLRGHEFHHSSLDNLPADARYAFEVVRGHGIDGRHDGILVRNLLASYTHLRSTGSCDWASAFVAFVREHRDRVPVMATDAHGEAADAAAPPASFQLPGRTEPC